jgi:quercetin dioxygenase-like cupin family protein
MTAPQTLPTNRMISLPEGLSPEAPNFVIHRDFIGDARRAGGEHPLLFAKLDTRGVGVIAGRMEAGHVSERHRHTHEAVMIMIEGSGYSEVEGQKINWKAGDVYVIPAWAWHQHFNGDETTVYMACDTLPVMKSLGLVAKQSDH